MMLDSADKRRKERTMDDYKVKAKQTTKHRLLIILMVISALLLTGCGSNTAPVGSTSPAKTNESTAKPTDPAGNDTVFTFTYLNTKITPFALADEVITALGESMTYFEAESCAFNGLDKIYTYNSFEISTVPEGGEDHISLIVLLDDTVATEEGIRIGSSRADVIAAYGDEYEMQGSALAYHSGKSILLFLLEADVVSAIEYVADYGV